MTVTTARVITATPALLTDRYELTMLDAALADGTAHHQATFECFGRRLPKGRRYGIVAGLGRLLPLIEAFRFDPDEIAFLLSVGAITDRTATYLRDFAFTGDIDAYREGEVYGPHSPLLTVRGTFAEGLLLETLILSVLNHDTAIASAAARMVDAADGRTLIDMGSRRTHEQAAIACARVAYLCGFDATSNLAAGYLYGIPTVGTAAHAWTLAHTSERAAFDAQIAAQGPTTTLLVDTYDIETGIRTAVEAAQAVGATGPGAIRIDSGDLATEARKARALLDSLGATATRITVTSDLDEHTIAALADAPVDGYGAGTRLATGSGAPTAGLVYKLTAIADTADLDAPQRPVAKKANGKISVGGRKVAYRSLDSNGHAHRENVVVRQIVDEHEAFPGRVLQVPAMRAGITVHTPTLAEVRAHHAAAKAELVPLDRRLDPGAPTLDATPR